MSSDASPSKEELLALLQQERERAQQERERADYERKRAEDAKQRAEQAEERNRNTTFAEYLRACHRCITKPLTIQTNRSLTTKGSITSPVGRVCPTFLRPWDFRAAQQALFDEIYQLFHPNSEEPLRVFPPLLVIEDRGQQACIRPLASESDLARHQEAEVENPVKEVIDRLAGLPAAPCRLPLGEGIIFENHTNTVTEEAGQVQPVDKRTLRADQNCVYMRNGSERSLLYVIEYKAAHKLPDAYLRAGLRPMNMIQEVVQQITLPTDVNEKLLYDAKLLSCAAVTQPFKYMITKGLPYSVLTNGHIKVILHVTEEDPTTLYYCVLEPSKDVEAKSDDGYGFRYPYTAIGSHLVLTIMALQTSQRSQLWRNEAMRRLHRWEVDFEEAVRSIPESERRKSPPDSDWRAPRYPIDPRSPYLLRRRKVPEFDPPLTGNRDTPESSSESDTALPRIPSSPVPVQRRKRQRTLNPQSGPKDSGQSRPPNKDYCTQACLQGLAHKREFDPECPNLSFHQKHSSNGRHPLSRSDLVKLVSEQLNRDPDHCCRPMGKEGLHGSLFTITLDAYGYTFVGKGTEYTSNYEAGIYRALEALQGYAVPVYLGDIYLRQNIYYLPTRAIVHISLMSLRGCQRQQRRNLPSLRTNHG